MHRRRFILNSGGIIGAFGLAGCLGGDGGSTPVTGTVVVESPDLDVTLEVPPDALPSGTSVDELSIERYEQGDGPVTVSGADLALYELEPDGIEFDRPITASVPVASERPTVPFMFTVSDGTVEPVTNTSVSITSEDSDAYQVQASAELEHFSTLGVSTRGFLSVDVVTRLNRPPGNPQRDLLLGQDYVHEFTLDPHGWRNIDVRVDGETIAIIKLGDLEAFTVGPGGTFTGELDNVRPRHTLPPHSGVDSIKKYQEDWLISCAHGGQARYSMEGLGVILNLVWTFIGGSDVELGIRDFGEDVVRKHHVSVSHTSRYRCIGSGGESDDETKTTTDATPSEEPAPTTETGGSRTPTRTAEPTTSTTQTPTTTTDTVAVIEYNGKYVPVSEVHKAVGSECDGDQHWHANGNSVTALDGTKIPDPGGCGYGKTAETPVQEVPEPVASD